MDIDSEGDSRLSGGDDGGDSRMEEDSQSNTNQVTELSVIFYVSQSSIPQDKKSSPAVSSAPTQFSKEMFGGQGTSSSPPNVRTSRQDQLQVSLRLCLKFVFLVPRSNAWR